jgi:hypothetical protein
MISEATESLLNALEQLRSCDSQATARGVVIDAYAAVDHCFSALCRDNGESPPRNHKVKLDSVFQRLEEDFRREELDYPMIESLYKQWLSCRYSQVSVEPGNAYVGRSIAHRVYHCTLQRVAVNQGLPAADLEAKLFEQLLGGRSLAYTKNVGMIHEEWQSEAERQGDTGNGGKLGNKIMNPSNFSELAIVTDDPVTREILAQNDQVGQDAAALYNAFLKLVCTIHEHRHAVGVELNDVPNYIFGIRMRYFGSSVEEIGNSWGQLLAEALGKSVSRLSRKSEE